MRPLIGCMSVQLCAEVVFCFAEMKHSKVSTNWPGTPTTASHFGEFMCTQIKFKTTSSELYFKKKKKERKKMLTILSKFL